MKGHVIFVLWMMTVSFLYAQAMSIYSTLAKPRPVTALVAAEGEPGEKTEEPANQASPSH